MKEGMSYSAHKDTILLGYSIGHADLDEGRLEIAASGSIVRFTLTGFDGYVDLDLSAYAAEAYTTLVHRATEERQRRDDDERRAAEGDEQRDYAEERYNAETMRSE